MTLKMNPATVMNQVWKIVGITVLLCGLQLYGQQSDPSAPAAAKAVGTFITFDVPGAVNGTFTSGINNEGLQKGAFLPCLETSQNSGQNSGQNSVDLNQEEAYSHLIQPK